MRWVKDNLDGYLNFYSVSGEVTFEDFLSFFPFNKQDIEILENADGKENGHLDSFPLLWKNQSIYDNFLSTLQNLNYKITQYGQHFSFNYHKIKTQFIID